MTLLGSVGGIEYKRNTKIEIINLDINVLTMLMHHVVSANYCKVQKLPNNLSIVQWQRKQSEKIKYTVANKVISIIIG